MLNTHNLDMIVQLKYMPIRLVRDADSTDRAQRCPFNEDHGTGRCLAPERPRALQVQNSCYRLQVTLSKVSRKMLIQASLSIIQANWSAVQAILARLKQALLV